MEKFQYQDDSDYGNNFRRWRELNDAEKTQFNEKLYTLIDASKVFYKMYWRKELDEICTDAKQKLEEDRKKRREGKYGR
jgi:hypothetical protein